MEISTKMHKVTVNSCWSLSPALDHVTETDGAYVGLRHVIQALASQTARRGVAATRQNSTIVSYDTEEAWRFLGRGRVKSTLRLQL